MDIDYVSNAIQTVIVFWRSPIREPLTAVKSVHKVAGCGILNKVCISYPRYSPLIFLDGRAAPNHKPFFIPSFLFCYEWACQSKASCVPER